MLSQCKHNILYLVGHMWQFDKKLDVMITTIIILSPSKKRKTVFHPLNFEDTNEDEIKFRGYTSVTSSYESFGT